jgi:DNA-binding transcriptional ArsR family regulator
MSALLPRKPPVERSGTDSQVVSLYDDDSDAVFSVLSSEVARRVLAELYRDPATQSELADRVGTSIQNVSYHLDNLADAGLVDVVDEFEGGELVDERLDDRVLTLGRRVVEYAHIEPDSSSFAAGENVGAGD